MNFKDRIRKYYKWGVSRYELRKLKEDIRASKREIKNDIEDMLEEDMREVTEHDKMRDELFDKMLPYIKSPATIMPWRAGSHFLRWRWIAAGIVVLASLGVIFVQLKNMTTNNTQAGVTVFKDKQFIHLPDGSTVLMNQGSELTYEPSFGKQVREVTLTGEAYFDVQHGTIPFVVRTGDIRTTVMGTAFNVKAGKDQEVVITVTRGKVKVGDEHNTYAEITPDQQVAVNTLTNDFVKKDVAAVTEVAWKDQYLILDRLTLEEAAKVISDRYHVNVTVEGDEVKKCRFSATFFNNEQLALVLAVVTGTINADYTRAANGDITISGKGCL